MYKPEDLITDIAIDMAFENADFGSGITKRQVINNAVLKCASGYHTGGTAKCIVQQLGLVSADWKLTRIGKEYLYAAFSNGVSI